MRTLIIIPLVLLAACSNKPRAGTPERDGIEDLHARAALEPEAQKLRNLYPISPRIIVVHKDVGAWYDWENNIIYIRDHGYRQNVRFLRHEGQHAIQHAQGRPMHSDQGEQEARDAETGELVIE